jgi:hypothetical protein
MLRGDLMANDSELGSSSRRAKKIITMNGKLVAYIGSSQNVSILPVIGLVHTTQIKNLMAGLTPFTHQIFYE